MSCLTEMNWNEGTLGKRISVDIISYHAYHVTSQTNTKKIPANMDKPHIG